MEEVLFTDLKIGDRFHIIMYGGAIKHYIKVNPFKVGKVYYNALHSLNQSGQLLSRCFFETTMVIKTSKDLE